MRGPDADDLRVYTDAPPQVHHHSELHSALHQATVRLTEAGVPSARVDAETLACHVLGVDRGRLLAAAYNDTHLPERFWDLIEQRADRVPLQHLIGRVWFRRIALAVGPGVFIPRPETEDVAGAAIKAASDVARTGGQPLVVDLGTGCGAIALAVADEVANASVVAIEIDPSAYTWAERNVARLDAGARVHLDLGDAATARPDLIGRADVVVSNPPYIPPGMQPIDPEVAEHDPEVALFGGGLDGLDLPRMVLARAAELLRPGGTVVMEHADSQQESILALLGNRGWSSIMGWEDLTGRPRYVTAVNRGTGDGAGHWFVD
ncbi:MAG: protein-(glutamine-N5) methyltransferase, release factor-specific [Micrococcales bacterium]|nr:MAG: protein-(glutamine-N5) methyltransferase, release factor-specific [Micrococcales bacterium]PIE28124.1 MAG: protein-(glutamine-N5) methyltransferase, release factor-specific [Micrococcales bacterium]